MSPHFFRMGWIWLKFPDFEIPIERNGIRLLGFPLGSSEFICSFINQRIKELEIRVSKLLEFPRFTHFLLFMEVLCGFLQSICFKEMLTT